MEKILRVITLFSGVGGIDLGFIQAGAEILWANDFQKDATINYANNIFSNKELYTFLIVFDFM